MRPFCVLFSPPLIAALLVSPVFGDGSQKLTVGISPGKPANGPFVAVEGGYMVPYTATIPGSDVTFRMIPVKGGTYKMGSPDSESQRREDEGPQVEVNVDAMWVAETEVNWQQYMQYMSLHDIFQKFDAGGSRKAIAADAVDAVTAPTPLYQPSFTFEFGQEPDQPATTMTRYAAQQYCKWLSLVSGQQYRLPTEAEWEYAARAGSTTAYNWGDDEDSAEEHAWFYDNSPDGPVAVGAKQPNAFGLHDMLGSVAEWTVNIYNEQGYASLVNQQPINATAAVTWASNDFRGVARGGSWESYPNDIRCAARMPCKNDEWKAADPNTPLSAWWYTNDPTRGIGMRIFRSYRPLGQETIAKFWGPNKQEVIEIVDYKVKDGRSYFGLVDPSLPQAVKELEN